MYFQDLISLLDAGINADHPSVIIDADAMFSEDMFGYAAQSRAARSSGRSTFAFTKTLNLYSVDYYHRTYMHTQPRQYMLDNMLNYRIKS